MSDDSKSPAYRLLWGEGKEAHSALSEIMGSRMLWKFYVPHVWYACLNGEPTSVRISAFSILGEIGMEYPELVRNAMTDLIIMLSDPNEKIRAAAVYTLGRIGRSDFDLVIGCIGEILKLTDDPYTEVRMAVVRGAENITEGAARKLYPYLPIFALMLSDREEEIRLEVPSIFRRMAELGAGDLSAYLPVLREMAHNDINRAVRLRAEAAVASIVESGL